MEKYSQKSKIERTYDFKISRMKEKVKAANLHKHDHCHELIFLTEGAGFHTIDLKPIGVKPPQVYLVKAGQIL